VTTEEHGGEDCRLLAANTGRIIDQLLGLAGIGQSAEAGELIDSARRGMRCGRPERDYVWPESLTHELKRFVPHAQGESKDAVEDIFRILEGETQPLVVDERWGLRRRGIPTPWSLEVAPFRTSHSFDDIAERFGQHINSGEPMEVLIRGHLWIEASVVALLGQVLHNPKALDGARLSFHQRLSFGAALGVISPADLLIIQKINQLRNRVAHDLDAQLSKSDEDQLISLCGEDFLEIAGLNKDRGTFPAALATVIATLVIGLRHQIDDLEARARLDEYLHERVQRVLSE
jgi:hypothetical protein